jgi:hypothetical protein
MAHSPEPWSNDADYIRDADGETVAEGFTELDDLERIVACVNACRGVGNEELRKIACWKDTIKDQSAAEAACLLSDLGWKLKDPQGEDY